MAQGSTSASTGRYRIRPVYAPQRLPIGPALQAAQARGIRSLIDGAHAPGPIPLLLSALGADYYTGNCNKWMCAPKGTAFLHARSAHHADLHAMVTSWGAVAPQGPSPWDGFIGNGLFERRMQWQGTRDLSGFLTVPDAIDFVSSTEWAAACADSHIRTMELMHRVSARTGVATIAADSCFGQMAPLPVPHQDAAALRARLYDDHHIEVPVTQHQGADGGRTFVRVSVQPSTTASDIAALESALDAVLQAR